MSSTYVHYSTPSSLPSDYALLSRYAAAHDLSQEAAQPIEEAESPENAIEDDDVHADPDGINIQGSVKRKKSRRSSFPTSYLTPFNPTLGPLPDKSGHRSGPKPLEATENTPLLAPLVPRIEEECDAEDMVEPPNVLKMFKEEAAVLVKYTVPVFVSESILLFLKQEPEVARLAAVYLRWAAIGLPAYAFNSISRRYFQSQGLFTVPTRIILGVAPINAALNYLLVWGPEPFHLGFIGAPIATAISFNLISLMSIVYGLFFVPKTAWHPLTMRCFTSLGVLVQLGLSGVGQVASEWWSWELVGLAASQLGPIALATQSVLLVSASTTYQAPFALSVASSVRIGNLLGEENAKRAAVASKCAVLMSLVISAVWSTMFMVFRHSWAHLFNDDPAVVSLVASILPLVSLFQVFDGLSAITAGILRAIGKQFTGALLNLSAYYVVGIPFGIWLAFWRGMQLHGLWIGLTVSLVYCAAAGVWLCLRTDWNREVEKVRVRLEADKHANRDVERLHQS
ncbi:hypothetical protein BN946_scf185016.g56 [Trametes cinnabarina]|uniref:Polysaccharide biosynthesis protein C-terminal domain-containing protein n=1 Tax=Pycnoporus cinnabarinus TaxID=5643 RepID=A0A060SNV8_PYCCI|nr:hypothetical protein BN946_scf185016.g56 [Trametes cinnabarina]